MLIKTRAIKIGTKIRRKIMNGPTYTQYIGMEIEHALKLCIDKPQFKEGYYRHPALPLISKVTRTSSAEANYATGPIKKTMYVEDAFGNRYKVSVEDLKEVKGHGWITYAEADKLGWFGEGVHYDKDLDVYVESDAEYVSWLAEARKNNFPSADPQNSFDFDEN